jgi:hypothetical protein
MPNEWHWGLLLRLVNGRDAYADAGSMRAGDLVPMPGLSHDAEDLEYAGILPGSTGKPHAETGF